MTNGKGYFLPYQVRWLADRSRLKIWEKSRRVGATYVQSYEDVRDAAANQGGMDVWFSSADESAAREYIRYCEQWARVLDCGARDLGEIAIDGEDDILAFSIEFANGKRINALSSSPKAFRSKGGKMVLDEFAWHKWPELMWAAAVPLLTWGYPARVLSTHNGKGQRYYRMVEEAQRGGSKWALHRCTIEDAVREGLADKVLGKALGEAERGLWLQELRETVGDEAVWLQEYMCEPVDEATAWLPWDLIMSCEDDAAIARYTGGPCFVGVDLARRRDLSVIWVLELVGDVLWSREVVALRGESFAAQEAELDRVMGRYKVSRLVIDQTGLGEQFAERARQRHGSLRTEGLLFTGPQKLELANGVRRRFEDRQVRIPRDKPVRDSLHSLRKTVTAAGNPRFDADRDDATGHADYFWALSLAIHGASDMAAPIEFQAVGGLWNPFGGGDRVARDVGFGVVGANRVWEKF